LRGLDHVGQEAVPESTPASVDTWDKSPTCSLPSIAVVTHPLEASCRLDEPFCLHPDSAPRASRSRSDFQDAWPTAHS
jgi:hypothetical protein